MILITGAVLAALVATGVRWPAAGSAPGGNAAALVPEQPAVLRAATAADRVLLRAARASSLMTYSGIEVLAWWGVDGLSTAALQVWHRPGLQAMTAALQPGSDLPGYSQRRAPLSGALLSPGLAAGASALTMSRQLAALLARNYLLAITGSGFASGRQALILTVRRRHGSLAARFWFDKVTGLPLRRQMFGNRSALLSEAGFADLTVGRGAGSGAPAAPGATQTEELATAQLARLRAVGWPLPGPLPGHLSLLDAREATTSSGPVIGLDYSDGLSQVSIFVQRGHLPSRIGGWSQVALHGEHVYAGDPDDLSVAWSARGYVYTVISSAPRQIVGQVVAALPHAGPPGVLSRIGDGLRHLLSLVSP